MDNLGYTLLHFFCLKGDINEAKKLLLKININSKACDGNTPLIAVSIQSKKKNKNRHSIIKLLLDEGANMYVENKNAQTFMQGCIVQGDYESIEYAFLKRKFNIHKKTIMGETPILSAAFSKAPHNTKMFDFLVEKGADLRDVDNDGENCLDIALRQTGNWRMIYHLLKKYSNFFYLF